MTSKFVHVSVRQLEKHRLPKSPDQQIPKSKVKEKGSSPKAPPSASSPVPKITQPVRPRLRSLKAEGPIAGLKCRPRKGGAAWYWIAATTEKGRLAVQRGYSPKVVRLSGTVDEIKSRCTDLQTEMVTWLKNEQARERDQRQEDKETLRPYDGTLGALIRLYFSSEESGFAALKYNVKTSYLYLRKILRDDYGDLKIKDLTRKKFFQMHKKYRSERGVSSGSELMNHLRMTLRFGIDLDEACLRAAETLKSMRFETSPGRSQLLTAEMVVAFRTAAHATGYPAFALAQAIQFETALRQKDCIGEWIPDVQPADIPARLRSAISTETWANGLVWGLHISTEGILVKPTSKSKGRKNAISDLSMCPMVLEELALIPMEQKQEGQPVVIDPKTGRPYRSGTFRNRWRKIATKAGIPEHICNMDSRAGAITEGSEADVPEDHLRQFATHTNLKQTQHYNRTTLKKARAIHAARAASREAEAPPARARLTDLTG